MLGVALFLFMAGKDGPAARGLPRVGRHFGRRSSVAGSVCGRVSNASSKLRLDYSRPACMMERSCVVDGDLICEASQRRQEAVLVCVFVDEDSYRRGSAV